MRLWRLLDRQDRRRVLWILPLLLLTAFVEVAGVAAVVPFLALLADPASVYGMPFVGPMFAASDMADPTVLLRWTGVVLAGVLLLANALVIVTFWWLYRFSWSLNHRLSSRLLGHYLAQPYVFMLTRNTAALANKVIVEVRHLVESGFQSGLEWPSWASSSCSIRCSRSSCSPYWARRSGRSSRPAAGTCSASARRSSSWERRDSRPSTRPWAASRT
jgi:hypothetical protein